MSTYERTISMEVDPEHVFRFVSDPDNLPVYVPTILQAERLPGDRVRVEGNLNGHAYAAEGYFRVDAKQRRIDWGSEGDHHYQGWLTVKPGDTTPFLSEVTIELIFKGGTGGQGEKILGAMEDALEAIRNHFEAQRRGA